MAYSTSNPPALRSQRLAGTSGKHWDYTSTDGSAVVAADKYFSNGYSLGMREGDVVWVLDTSTQVSIARMTVHSVGNASATGGVDLATLSLTLATEGAIG
jgi:hypothetical protein